MKHHYAHHSKRAASATAVHAPGWVEGIASLSETSPATTLMVSWQEGVGCRGVALRCGRRAVAGGAMRTAQ